MPRYDRPERHPPSSASGANGAVQKEPDLTTVLLLIHLFVTLALIGVVLIQRSEGGGLGVGTSQGMGSFMSGRGTANLLTRATAVLATIFMLLSLTLALMNRGTSGIGRSILDVPPGPSGSLVPGSTGTAPASPGTATSGAAAPASSGSGSSGSGAADVTPSGAAGTDTSGVAGPSTSGGTGTSGAAGTSTGGTGTGQGTTGQGGNGQSGAGQAAPGARGNTPAGTAPAQGPSVPTN